MKKLAAALIGGEEFSFEQRIFHFAILMAVIMTAMGAAMDALGGAAVAADLAFTCFWALTYYLARFQGLFQLFSHIAFGVLVFAYLPYAWISSSGLLGVVPLYAIVFLTTVCIVLSGRMRVVMALSLLAVVLLLILRDALLYGSFEALLERRMPLYEAAAHLCIILVAMATLLIAYTNMYMREKARSEAYAKATEQNYRQQLYYMETLEGLIDRLKSERHDWNSHLGVIYGLLEDGDSANALEYAAARIRAAGEYRNIVNVPYSMLRALLNYKLSLMREHGVDLRLDVGLPEGLALNEADLAVILGNLLDNAFEACLPLQEEERYLALTLVYKPDYLIIKTENPVGGAQAAGGRGHTSKPDSEDHGFGLLNIEYLVNKHSGMMKMEPSAGLFRVSLALLAERTKE